MDTVWIVVAEAARARILSCQGRTCRELKEVEALAHTESRLRSRDLVSDRPGRSWADAAGSGRHAMAEPTDPATHELARFARMVVDRLQAAHHQGLFKHLVIVAAPTFLGALREAMDRPLAQTVRAEVAKNVVKIEDPEGLRAYLPDFIY
jgi:protein required for attachment to host cells